VWVRLACAEARTIGFFLEHRHGKPFSWASRGARIGMAAHIVAGASFILATKMLEKGGREILDRMCQARLSRMTRNRVPHVRADKLEWLRTNGFAVQVKKLARTLFEGAVPADPTRGRGVVPCCSNMVDKGQNYGALGVTDLIDTGWTRIGRGLRCSKPPRDDITPNAGRLVPGWWRNLAINRASFLSRREVWAEPRVSPQKTHVGLGQLVGLADRPWQVS